MDGLFVLGLLLGFFQDHHVAVADAAVVLHLVLQLDIDDVVVLVAAQRTSHPWSVPVGKVLVVVVVVLHLFLPFRPTLVPSLPQQMDSDVVSR
jgi:hypothetical protein